MQAPVRVAFLRDPIDRLGSAYRFFFWIRAENPDLQIDADIGHWDNWQEFIDWALYSDNAHIRPQYELLLTEAGEFVPNRLHWLRDIERIWDDYYPGLIPSGWDFPVIHKTSQLDMASYRLDEIRERWAKDFELCRTL